MSRFSVNISKFEQSSLSDNQIKELFANIEKKLPDLINVSQKNIKHLLQNHLDYRLITVGNDYVIVIKKTQTANTSICIGYPFPIISKNIHNHIFDGFCISYYIRGPLVRDAQRQHLIQKLKESNKNCYIKFYRTKYGLRHALKQYLKNIKPTTLCYVDLYRFIGDSFLSTYMLDAFVKEFDIKQTFLLSNQASKLAGFYDILELNNWDNIPENSIYVFADLLDIDEAWIHEFAVKRAKNGIYILNSRNSFFVKHGDSIQYFAINGKPDILLTFDNIFTYMHKCVSAFIKTKLTVTRSFIQAKKIQRIYINPFSSSRQKSFSAQEMDCLVHQLQTSLPNIDIIIPFGHDAESKKFSINYSKKLKLRRLHDNGFYDLINKIHLHGIDLIITPDTALTHIATKYNIKNIVIFKSGFWDPLSLQSLSAESPLSFISTNPCQLPIVLSDKNNTDFQKVLDIIHLIQDAKKQKVIKTCSFCSRNFSLFKNIRLLRLQRLLGTNHKLTYYKK